MTFFIDDRRYSAWFCPLILLACTLFSASTFAFDKLTKAQAWIYDSSHLSNTDVGQLLTYNYQGTDDAEATVKDDASLSVIASQDDGLRDVEIDFLSGERYIALPTFKGYRGNPMIIAMLEHVAQSMSAQAGGGALYFRNRIRDSLASGNVEILESIAKYDTKEHDAITMTFYPFKDDEYLKEKPELQEAKFVIQLSNDIPGGLFSVDVSSRRADAVFERRLTLQ